MKFVGTQLLNSIFIYSVITTQHSRQPDLLLIRDTLYSDTPRVLNSTVVNHTAGFFHEKHLMAYPISYVYMSSPSISALSPQFSVRNKI